jgi:ribosomal protein L13E
MIETLRSHNGRRNATIERVQGGGYVVKLDESRKLGTSTRTRRAARKPEAVEIARKWVRR